MPITYQWLENVKGVRGLKYADEGILADQINAIGIVELFDRLRDLETEIASLKEKLGMGLFEEEKE